MYNLMCLQISSQLDKFNNKSEDVPEIVVIIAVLYILLKRAQSPLKKQPYLETFLPSTGSEALVVIFEYLIEKGNYLHDALMLQQPQDLNLPQGLSPFLTTVRLNDLQSHFPSATPATVHVDTPRVALPQGCHCHCLVLFLQGGDRNAKRVFHTLVLN